jgi:urea transport system substrate-binding protein
MALSLTVLAWQADPVRIGVLYPMTGPDAATQTPLRDAVLLAVEEINATGGVLGRRVEPVVVDPGMTGSQITQAADGLLTRDRVAAVFGGGSGGFRKIILPTFELRNGLFFYSMPPEGEEQSENIFYLGGLPNQRVAPAVDFIRSAEGGSRKWFFLLATDDFYTTALNKTLKRYLLLKSVPAGNIREEIVPFGHQAFSIIVEKIKDLGREGDAVVFASITRDESIARFYEEFFAVGLDPAAIPIVSLNLSEADLKIAPKSMSGHLIAGSYFPSIELPENRRFVESFKQKYGATRLTGEAIATAYSSVFLWKAAAEKAASFDVDKVRTAVLGLEYDSPGGRKRMHPLNHYSSNPFFLGRIRGDLKLDFIFKSDGVAPEPYPR